MRINHPPRLTEWLATALTLLIGSNALASVGVWVEPNVGQTDERFKAIARASDLTLLLSADRARILLPASTQQTATPDEHVPPVKMSRSLMLELVLHDANESAELQLGELAAGISRYFKGASEDSWQTQVAHYKSARFVDVYPGIDLVYRFRGAKLEYDFILAPGADLSAIQLELTGANDVGLEADGDWVARTAVGEFRQRAPEIFRMADAGLQPVAGRFINAAANRFGFEADGTTADTGLLVDPVIEFSGYLGGSADDTGYDIATNLRGNIVVSGTTSSVDIVGAPPGVIAGAQDLYFGEIDRNTGQLLWINYIGGSADDSADSMDVDSQGNIVAVGYTNSADFPLANAFQNTFVGSQNPADSNFNWDGIVLKFSDDGSALIFSTYYGGLDLNSNKVGFEWFRGLAIDDDDNIYAAGQTSAADFPVTDLFRGRSCMQTDGAAISSFVSDIALVKFAPDGTRLFATCIGGTERDGGRDVVIGPQGDIYVAGFGRSLDLPTSVDAFQPVPPNGRIYAAFILKLNADLSDIVWGTYLGGADIELMQEIAVDAAGFVYATGTTYSFNFPVTPNAIQTEFNGGVLAPFGNIYPDAFVTKLLPDGTGLSFSTYFGGARWDESFVTQVDDAGRIYIAGYTQSRDLSLRTPIQDKAGPLFSRPRTISSAATFRNLAVYQSVFNPDRIAAVANNGVNQYHIYDRLDMSWGAPVSFGTAVADSRAVVPDPFANTISFVNALAANRRYVFDEGTGSYINNGTFGDASRDSRAAAAISTFGGGTLDIVVGNYGQQNQIFVDAAGPAIPIGRVDGKTVAVATGNFLNSNDIVFANETQDVRIYRSLNGSFAAPVVLSLAPTVTSLAAGDIDGDGRDDLVVGSNPGPLRVTRFQGGIPTPAVEIPNSTANTLSVLLRDGDSDGDLDLFVGNVGFDQLYLNDGNGNFTLATDFLSDDEPTLALSDLDDECVDCKEPVFIGGGALRHYPRSNIDIFVAVFDPDAGKLEFATYLDGKGTDNMFRSMKLLGAGKILLTGVTDGDDWPVTGVAQSVNAGKKDAVMMLLNIDVDDDGVLDGSDNCLTKSNPAQRDTDNDDYGNTCDPDFNNDGIINFTDLVTMRDAFFGTDPDADLNGDGTVNFADLSIMSDFFFASPGPSGVLLD